jgi:hypothetical protein
MSLGSVGIARNEAEEWLQSDEESQQRWFPRFGWDWKCRDTSYVVDFEKGKQ